MTKLGPAAFDFYVGLADKRSYDAVADKFGVTKRAVSKHAAHHRWQERLTTIEQAASAKSVVKLTDALSEMNDRHLRVVKAVQARALEALRTTPLRTGLDAVKALDFALRTERTILGEPTERAVLTVEQKIKDEYQKWMSAESQGSVVDVIPETTSA
jgi:membrane carboxypeptidase/penicillin-binding protein